MNELKIVKGGKLIRSRWNPQLKKYVKKDVSKDAISCLFDNCVLDKNVTLRDIFLILNKNLEIFDQVFKKWTKEIVKEGLTQKAQHKDLNLKTLELFWMMSKSKNHKNKKMTFGGYSFPCFHGVGRGNTKYGLDYLSAADIIDVPVKLSQELTVFNREDEAELYSMGVPEYSLGQILYGIIWELGYHGDPKTRDKDGSSLK